jgi:hypothetical protein
LRASDSDNMSEPDSIPGLCPGGPWPGTLAGMTSSEPEPAGAEPAVPAVDTTAEPDDHPIPVDYTDAGVPTFDFVRDRIEGRAATALGQGELDAETPEGRTLAQQEADRDAAARDRLEQIRRSMNG